MYNGPEDTGLMKICKMCKVEKNKDEFYKKSTTKDGKHIYCGTCMKAEKKEYYQRTKDDRADYYKTYRKENKEYFNKPFRYSYLIGNMQLSFYQQRIK